ncbi:MAG: 2-C-methyl-D-erythritol 4-phosphate cytidylyltransferase [Treponema sp.]|nr:2-C-methyl-D-erythritol 4-phosphate cytidylyltransferase [Treponema sp.]
MTISMTTTLSNIGIIITAAGSSTRMGGSIKKEYLPLKDGTVLSNCAKTFLRLPSNIYNIVDFIITCPKGGIEACKKALSDLDLNQIASSFQIIEGAESRQASVYNAIKAIKNNPDLIAIHDGARPFVSLDLIRSALDTALEYGASVPGCQPVDTQKEIDDKGFIVRHLQRSSLTAVQTPQCFDYKKMLAAHQEASLDGREYTDDTEIWGAYCGPVKVLPGETGNIKITYPGDLERGLR